MIDYQTEPSAPAEVDSGFDIREYTRLLVDRRRMIGSICLLGLAIGALHYAMTPKLFRAKTTIQIEQRSMSPIGSDRNPWLEAWWSMKYYPTQYRLLQSRGLAEQVVLNLRLMDDPRFNPAQATLAGREETETAVTAGADDRMLASLANRVLAGLSVEPVRDTELVDIAFTSSYPDLAADVANGMATAFINWSIDTRTDAVATASRFLEQQVEILKQEIDDKERELQQYGRQTDIVNLDPGSNLTLKRLDRLNQDLASAVGTRLDKEARYKQLLSVPPETIADRESQGLVQKLSEQLNALERQYEADLERYKPDWPAMRQLKAQIDEGARNLKRVIDDNLGKARKSAYAEYQAALQREQALEEEIQKVKSEAMDFGLAAIEFKNLEMVVAKRRELLDSLLDRLMEAGVSMQLQTTRETNIRQIEKALVPGGAFRPSLTNDLTVGAGAGLLLGVGLVLLIHFLDRTVKSADELERLVGLPVLAVIPDIAEGSRGYSYYRSYGYGGPRKTRDEKRASKGRKPEEEQDLAIELLPERRPQLAVSEAYRSLRTALVLSTAKVLKTVTITSADAGEGKSCTAANLAVVMAQLGRRVLLVDADLRKARLHRIFEISNRVGLVNYLTGSVQPDDILQATGIANLTVCPSGPHPPNPSELLASERMQVLLDQAAERFDLVLIDTPPVLVVTDAILTGSITDGVVLCFRANKVLREDAQSCCNRLRLAGVKILGAVLNRYRPGRSGYYDRRYLYYEAYSTENDPATVESAVR